MTWKSIDNELSSKLKELRNDFVFVDREKDERKFNHIRDEISRVKWELECHRGDGCEV